MAEISGRVRGFGRRYTLAVCCILGPILLAFFALNLAVKDIMPPTTPSLPFTYEAAKPKAQAAAPQHAPMDESEQEAPKSGDTTVVPDANIYPLALSIAGRYNYAVASGFIYLVSAAAILFSIGIAIQRMTVFEFVAAVPVVILALLIGTSKLMPTPYDFARPLIIDNLLNTADSFDALKPLGTNGTGKALACLVGVNTVVALVAVAMILISLFLLAVRPDEGSLTRTGLKNQLTAIRWALMFGSGILVAGVLSSKTLLQWPLRLVSDAQAAALSPIADALTLELGATGTFALFAGFAPAIAAWTLDVNCFRAAQDKIAKPTPTPTQPSPADPTQSDDADENGDGLLFAPLSMLSSIFAVLAPLLASPFTDALKGLLGAFSK